MIPDVKKCEEEVRKKTIGLFPLQHLSGDP
jgi:hypothetical protein